MASATQPPDSTQHHDFALPLRDGAVDLEQISTADLTRFVSIFLGALADRRIAEQ